MNLEKIAQMCGAECARQKVGLREVGYLLDAYLWLTDTKPKMNGDVFQTLGSLVEPWINRHGYRKVPVTFGNGGSSANASEIPRLMISLRDEIHFFRTIPPQSPEGAKFEVDGLVKQFLWIHPFADGNGRVGFLLQNYLEGTLDNPNPLRQHF